MSGIPAGAGSLLGKRLGKYEILALLALGGTAEIYLARIDGTNGFEKYVVVKCLHDHLADDPEFVKMFLDEARMAAMLDHSNIVQTLELGEHEERYYMVMEFLAGLSLAMMVRRAQERVSGGRLPVPLVLNIAAQAAAGLHYAHERQQGGKPMNMVHRDISPQNLVVGFEGVVKVVDFGIARAEYRETKTKAGTIKGKFAYMSPEQCIATNVDRRTDVFALGVIVHELLTGRRLFKRNSPYETYQAVIDCAVPPPSQNNVELEPAIDEIVMKAVAKDKDLRYPTAEAFGDALQGYLHHRGKGSGPGEIGRWFEEHFQQEIEEHGERMRELITGRDISLSAGVGDLDAKPPETVPFAKKKSAGDEDEEEQELSLETNDIEQVRGSEASLDSFVERLGTDSDERGSEEDGDAAPERTRIEANPLERLQELESQAAANKHPVPKGSVTNGPAPLPAPPASASEKSAIPSVLSVSSGMTKAKSAPTSVPKSGRFPDAAQMPTVVADEEHGNTPPPAQAAKMASQRVPKTPSKMPPPSQAAAYKATMVHQAQPEMAPTAAASPLDPVIAATIASGRETKSADVPVIGRESSTHASIQIDEVKPRHDGPRAHAPTDSPYPVMAGGGRPLSVDIAPSSGPGSANAVHAGMAPPTVARTSSADFRSQQAANLMSPVGDQYPANSMDWEAAAAAPAKALTPVQLGLLFVGAVVGALLLTMVIAKIIH